MVILATFSTSSAGIPCGFLGLFSCCGDTTGPASADVPCNCGDIVTTDTVLNATDDVLQGGCNPVGLYVADNVSLDAHQLNPPNPGLCDGSLLTSGIVLVDDAHLSRGIIRGCSIGVSVGGDGNTIERVTASGLGVGFLILGDKNTLLTNQCHDNVLEGIFVVGSENVLQRNYCTRNGQGIGASGIAVVGHSNILNTNQSHHNGGLGINAPGPNASDGRNYATGNQPTGTYQRRAAANASSDWAPGRGVHWSE